MLPSSVPDTSTSPITSKHVTYSLNDSIIPISSKVSKFQMRIELSKDPDTR